MTSDQLFTLMIAFLELISFHFFFGAKFETISPIFHFFGFTPPVTPLPVWFVFLQLRSGGAQVLEGCIAEIHNITSLDISDNGKSEIREEKTQKCYLKQVGKGKIIFQPNLDDTLIKLLFHFLTRGPFNLTEFIYGIILCQSLTKIFPWPKMKSLCSKTIQTKKKKVIINTLIKI